MLRGDKAYAQGDGHLMDLEEPPPEGISMQFATAASAKRRLVPKVLASRDYDDCGCSHVCKWRVHGATRCSRPVQLGGSDKAEAKQASIVSRWGRR